MSATLASLRIRNLALVEDLLWEPRKGFVAITGETGAGKSIIMGAVNLLVGERADKSVIRSGSEMCTVEGEFLLDKKSPVHEVLETGGVEPCEDGRLLIRRTLSTNGSGKQFTNGSPCTLTLLRQIGDLLMDLHGPHDHQSLFSRDQQLLLLDGFAGAEPMRVSYAAARKEWMHLVEEKNRLVTDAAALAREIDLLTHQTQEIGDADLKADEEEPLLARQKAAANGKRLSEICTELSALASESDDSLASRLGDVNRLARELHRLDPQGGALEKSAAELFENLQDFSRGVEKYASTIEGDPSELSRIEARLDVLQSLKRKYGPTVGEVISFGEQAADRLAELRGREERGAGLDGEISRAAAAMNAAAQKLTKARHAAAPKLAALAKRHLADLGFAKSGFSISLDPLESPGPLGCEQAEFLFSPNPGEPERPLRAIASSGEISRVMLALKTALAVQDSVPVLVFDEIDANVGGEIGAKVGAKMKELGSNHQVFCITHLPQVAALASSHYIVAKDTAGKRTSTSLTEAAGDAREAEIARMLGGKADSALSHARALLGER
ncbi:MAG: DNA repair protein RecN [Verrucomicrobiaceae bacterium]|nr:MAG: DNA repair protein RecN [Verrucomicrobiaceae bacterium]